MGRWAIRCGITISPLSPTTWLEHPLPVIIMANIHGVIHVPYTSFPLASFFIFKFQNTISNPLWVLSHEKLLLYLTHISFNKHKLGNINHQYC